MSGDLDNIEFSQLSLQDKLFLYCADALEEAEKLEVETLLNEGDEAALAALAEAQDLMGQLPRSLDPVVPSSAVEEALIARASASAALPSPISLAERRASKWMKPIALAAGLSLILGGSLAWMQRERSHAESLDQLARSMSAERAEQQDQVRAALSRIATVEAEREAAAARAEALAQKLARVEAVAASKAIDLAEKGQAAPAAREAQLRALRLQVSDLEGLLAERARVSEGLDEPISESTRRAKELEAQLTTSREALALVRAPDVGIVDLLPPEAGGPSSASVFWDRALKNCYLHVRALPQVEGAERYALWLEYKDGDVVRISDFRVDARGDAEFFEDLPSGKGDIIRTFVTREATPNALRPNDQVVLAELVVEKGEPGSEDLRRRRYRRRSS